MFDILFVNPNTMFTL